ncbi:hypothetical protein SAMN02745130_00991 [Thiothrix eikelboomii]|uniref:Uncharacterized protein n=1 Tax=Thiothrix eikelboomii TaxID=92487 RepID=A0A1T4W525_9GAMM|nr:hypothetical protein [Thiothrix eikelboomii]SKA72158.1 hypothetical protein SAMN02745130_00991 [Thiothrix eikelboomii]
MSIEVEQALTGLADALKRTLADKDQQSNCQFQFTAYKQRRTQLQRAKDAVISVFDSLLDSLDAEFEGKPELKERIPPDVAKLGGA